MQPIRLLAALLSSTVAMRIQHRTCIDTSMDSQSIWVLTKAADEQVPNVISNLPTSLKGQPRALTRELLRLVVPFTWNQSKYYHDETFIGNITTILKVLSNVQHDDGTFTNGNIHSPPDTGFLIEDFATIYRLSEGDDHPSSSKTAFSVLEILKKAGPGLASGGIHTPNHRWKLSSAISHIANITEDESLHPAIHDWLAEGIDIDSDGIYSERSPIYYSEVTNPSLLNIAHEMGMPDLIDHVRANLNLAIEHTHVNGDIEVIQSRRQDQDQSPRTIRTFYPQFRELALLDNSPRFAFICRMIERIWPGELGDYLGPLIARPSLLAKLPDFDKADSPFQDFSKLYKSAGLYRHRQGNVSASVFGGTDWFTAEGERTPFYNRFGSGLSTNPTLFRAWSSNLTIEAIRLIPNFFSMGHFRSAGIQHDERSGAITLQGELAVPYYRPIPADKRNAHGQYEMSPSVDGRFYSALDFSERPANYRTLKIDVTVNPDGPKCWNLEFDVSGEENVDLTWELTFRDGGRLEGVGESVNADGKKVSHLTNGTGTYTVGKDSVKFGPGSQNGVVMVEGGEQYKWLGGSLELAGTKVYITAKSPAKYTLKLEFS